MVRVMMTMDHGALSPFVDKLKLCARVMMEHEEEVIPGGALPFFFFFFFFFK